MSGWISEHNTCRYPIIIAINLAEGEVTQSRAEVVKVNENKDM